MLFKIYLLDYYVSEHFLIQHTTIMCLYIKICRGHIYKK